MWQLLLAVMLFWSVMQVSFGGELPPPTPRKDRPVADELYFRRIAQEHNNLVITTTNPNGAIRGTAGDLIVYNNVGSYKFCVLITAPTTWRCSANALTAP